MAERGAEVTPDLTFLRRRLVSGGAWAIGGRVAGALIVLGSNALLARILSPQDLGAYFLAMSVVTLGALLGSLGLNGVVVRFVAESMGLNRPARTRRVVGMVSCLGALGAIGVGLVYLLLGNVLARGIFQDPALGAVTGLVAGWIVAMSLQGLLAETFRGFQDIRLATLFGNFGGLVSAGLLLTTLTLLWSLGGQVSLAAVVLLAAGSSCAATLLGGWILRRKVANLPGSSEKSRVAVGEVWRVAWPILVINVTLFVLAQADLWIVGAFLPQEEVAVYGAAVKLVLLVATPLVVVNAVAPPLIAEMYAQGKRRELERILRAVATLAGAPAFLVFAAYILLGGPLLGLVFGDYYREGAFVLALLALGQLASVFTGACVFTLIMTGHQLMTMTITAACGVLVVLAGMLLVREYGIAGVAAATAAGQALQNILALLGARFATGMWTHVGLDNLTRLLRAARTGG